MRKLLLLSLLPIGLFGQTTIKPTVIADELKAGARIPSITVGTSPNTLTIDADKAIRMNGSVSAWEDLRIDGQNFGTGPSAPALTDSFLGVSGFQQRMFQGSIQDDEAFFNIQMPHQWKQGGGLEIHLHLVPWTAPVAADSAVFQFSYAWANIGGTFTTTLTTDTTCIHLNGTAQWGHKLVELANLASPAVGKTLSSVLVCRLRRLAHTNNNDTYTGGISVLYVDLHYEVDSFGSDAEILKQ